MDGSSRQSLTGLTKEIQPNVLQMPEADTMRQSENHTTPVAHALHSRAHAHNDRFSVIPMSAGTGRYSVVAVNILWSQSACSPVAIAMTTSGVASHSSRQLTHSAVSDHESLQSGDRLIWRSHWVVGEPVDGHRREMPGAAAAVSAVRSDLRYVDTLSGVADTTLGEDVG